MQLSPLQSRLAASAVASCLLVLLYFALFSPQLALAAELKEAFPIILDDADFVGPLPARSPLDPSYEPDFALFDRSIIGRAPAGVTTLQPNVPSSMNVVPGTTQYFMFPAASLSTREGALDLRAEHPGPVADGLQERDGLAKRANRTVFVSANTCLQPQAIDPTKTTMDPPQLTMYVSTSPFNQAPNPMGDRSKQTWVEFTEGAAMFNTTTSSDLYFGIYAPNVSTVFTSTTYNFQVAASADNWYHSFNVQADADLIWVDSDSQGALLITHNLTDSTDPAMSAKIMQTQPYVMFAQNVNDRSINGLRYSYCGLANYAQIAAIKNGKFTSMVKSTMTRRGQGNMPKQQFYFSGLNTSSSYLGILASPGNSSTAGKRAEGAVGGGGHVFRATNFTTKSDHGNCNIITDLQFCTEVTYAVPSNPSFSGNTTALAKIYDDYAASVYDTFTNKVMAQIPCEAPSSQRYSLARTCDDCKTAYKNWLCSVVIPKCEDFNNQATYLQPRAINQSFPNGDKLSDADASAFPQTNAFLASRNPLIDEKIAPGPYKEVLPCEDLCYTLVQSCPAKLSFSCPQPGDPGFNTSYGVRTSEDANGEITCNYPGSMHLFSAGGRNAVPWVLVSLTVVLLALELL
ncbi:hypothetical protein GQ53DRAFT_748774 [Thozetella sp. PMI_491]|nr:hypothetical protein GQ53DRAFT_748774 [Thozetella sp. PMI_491]